MIYDNEIHVRRQSPYTSLAIEGTGEHVHDKKGRVSLPGIHDFLTVSIIEC